MSTQDCSQLEALCNNAQMALFIMDERQHCTYMNPAAEQLTGFSLAEVQGAPLHDFIHHTRPDGRHYPLAECPIDRAFPERNQAQGEDVFVHKDGHFYDVAFTASPIHEHGRVVGTVIEVQAIGARKRREAHQHFLAEVSHALGCLSEADTIMQTVGARLCRYLHAAACTFGRVEPEAAMLHSVDVWQESAPPLGGAFCLADFQSAEFLAASRAGQPVVIHDSQQGPRTDTVAHSALNVRAYVTVPGMREGKWTYLLTVIDTQPRQWRDDEVALIQEFANLVFPRYERMRVEEALRESEARYRDLFQAIDQGFCVIEVLFNESNAPYDLRFVERNPAAARHTGLPDDVIGKTVLELLPDYETSWIEAYGRVALTGEPLKRTDYVKSLGRYFAVEAFRTGHPERRQVVVLFSDITERKAAAEALRAANAQLREADRRKDEFLAMLGHELRNPLAAIRNVVSWFHRHMATVLPRRQLELLDRQTRNLTLLVDDLLDVSRVTRGVVALRREPIDLRVIIQAALESVEPLVQAHHHDLRLELPESPVRVSGDRVRLEQVLVNLVRNAVKYTDDGGVISLSLRRQGSHAELRVRDNGMGITPDVLEMVFDLFRQADQALDRAQGGLGIGLTITRHLVEQHGGTIEARSDGPGQGAEFIVRLPLLADDEATAESGTLAESHSARAVRILVVDDNRDIAETLAMLLQELGHSVETAFDGVSALAKAPLFKPEVIFLDIGLPGMDGFEVARRLRQDPALAGVTLCALSGYGGTDFVERAAAAGFDRHFTKPVDIEALERLIEAQALR